ncbi:DeoD-type purine-nucleoside phosphorylase, partial [Neobacillus drentensis]|uniref:purine-nucleoside phosphorylase n=1 Tax=Neobacillus drentensis TaxID=220684 RepID=UPI0030030B6D
MTHLCTPHIRPEENIIAEQILLPGDPLRAKFIADNYLEHVQQFNGVRNMLGFTGTYKGQQVSVMGSGMGMPSMGIYSWELIHVFGVKKLMRIGSCAALQEHIKLYDMIISTTASTNSNYASQFELPGSYSPVGDYHMISRVTKQLDDLKMPYHVGGVLSTDIFYNANKNVLGKWKAMGILGVD